MAMVIGLVAIVLTGCGGSGYRYVADRDVGVYFKIPEQWTTFSGEAVTEHLLGQTADADRQRLIGFDADPDPDVAHVLSDDARFPTGISSVRLLTARERDELSLGLLRNEFILIDALPPESVRVLEVADVETEGGLHGIEGTFELMFDEPFTLTQVVLVDASTTAVYGLVLGCTRSCYEDQRTHIEAVMDSWTVEEP